MAPGEAEKQKEEVGVSEVLGGVKERPSAFLPRRAGTPGQYVKDMSKEKVRDAYLRISM